MGVFATSAGFHIGVLHRRDEEPLRASHLAFHHDLRDEIASDLWGWVEPVVSADKLHLVAAFARRVHRAHRDGQVPYAFRFEHSRFSPEGRLLLGRSEHGLTCASYVLAVFREVGVEVLALATWAERSPARVAEDTLAQAALVELLRRRDSHHAEAVAAELGCLRFRPEEVAAATASPPLPVSYERAQELGRTLTAEWPR